MEIRKITSEDIKRYRNEVLKSSSASTFDRKIFSLKKFFDWTVKEGFVDENPVEEFLKAEEEIIETKLGKIERQRKLTSPSYNSAQAKIIAKLAGIPKLQKLAYHLFYTRPKWYISYHKLPIASYFNYAVLIILMSGLGYGVYNQFFKTTSTPLAYPTSLTTAGRYLSFQGRLTNNLSNPITVSTNMVFKLYNVNTGGTALWDSSTCAITPDVDGIFSTLLGSNCGTEIPASVFSENSAIWLGVTVGADAEATPRVQIATVAYALNAETLQGYPASESATANTIPAINSSGFLVLGSTSPKIQSTSGTFAIEGQAMTISTPNASNGSITINPDGTGTLNLIFEGSAPGGSAGGFVNATNANITSGALYYGSVASGATGYNLLQLQSGATPTNKFVVDYAGNITASGTINGLTISSGTISGATWNGSVIGTQYGGTGQNWSAVAQGSVPYFNGTGTMSTLAPGTSGWVLTTQGTGANPTWTDAGSLGTNYWSLGTGTIYPGNTTLDLLLGSSATSSAKFAFTGVNSGTPTASVSGSIANVATYLDGNGNLSTTNMNNLTLGSSTTGSVIINSRGINSITANGNGTSIAGVLTLSGNALGSPGNLTINPMGGNVNLGASDNLNLTASTNLIFGSTTSLGETTAADDSGAYVVGAFDEFTYSTSSNVQGVLKDFDTKLGTLTGNDFWQLTTNSLSPVNSTYALNVGSTASTSAFFHVPGTNNQDAWFNLGTGKLGIGTTSPTAALDVAGTASVSGSLTFRTGAASVGATTMSNLTLGSSTTGNVIINSAGSTALTANGADLTAGGTFTLPNSNTLTGVTSYVQSSTGFSVGGGTTYYFDSSGSINANAGTFAGNLDVNGTANDIAGTLNLSGNTLTSTGDLTINPTGGDVFLGSGDNLVLTSAANLFLDSDTAISDTGLNDAGAYLVGSYDDFTYSTSSNVQGVLKDFDTKLGTLTGNDFWQLTSSSLSPVNSTYALNIGNTASTSAFFHVPGTNNQDAWFNLGTGKLGIGTTSPTAALDVAGAASVSGNLTLGNGSSLQSAYGPVTLNYKSGADTWAAGLILRDVSGDVELAGGSGSTGCTIANASGNIVCSGTVNGLTISSGTISSGTWNGTAIGTQYGGTGANNSTAAQYSVPYYSTTGVLGGVLTPGTDGYVLTTHSTSGAPTWTPASGLGTNYWQLNSLVLSPTNAAAYDLTIGGSATGSAFQVFAATGNITTAGDLAVNGDNISADGTLEILGATGLNLQATTGTINIDSLAATQIINMGSSNVDRTINIGTGTGVDTIHIGDGATGADVITIGSANAGAVTVRSNAALTLHGEANSIIDFVNFDVDTSGNIVAAGTIDINGVGTNDIAGTLNLSGNTLTSTGDLTINPTGGDVFLGASDNLVLTSAANLFLDSDTALSDSSLNDAGAYLVGSYDDFTNSSSTNVQGVLKDLDTAITGAGVNHWQLNSNVLAPINVTNDLAIGGNATGSAKFQIMGTTGNIYTANNTIDWTLNNAVDALNIDSDTISVNASSNRVGIGNNAPNYPLDVTGSAAFGTSGYKIILNGAVSSGEIYNTNTALTLAGGSSPISNSGIARIVLGNNDGIQILGSNTGGQNITIDTRGGGGNIHLLTGDVGIGTTNPSAKLDVNGNVNISGYATMSASLAVGNTTALAGVGNINASGRITGTTIYQGANQVCDASGNCGSGVNHWQLNSDVLAPINVTNDLAIGGNATSSAKFQVFGATGNASSSGTLTFRGATDPKINILNGENFGIQTSTGGDAGLTERFTILNNGDVGIGTTSPSGKLDVTGGQLVIDDGSFSSPSLKFRGANTGFFRGSDDRIEFVTGGNTALQIYQDQLRVKRGTSGSPGVAWGDSTGTGIFGPTTSTIAFSVNSYEKVRIDSNGNVGINTTSPLSKLSVVGTATNAIGKAAFLVDQYESQDILTASASGQTKMTLKNDGTLSLYNATSTISNTSGDITLDAASNLISFSGDNIGNIGKITASSVINVGGLSGVNYNALAGSGDAPASTAITTNNDVFVGGDLELKGGLYLTGKNIFNVVGGVSTGAITLASDPTLINSYNALSYGSWLINNSTNNGLAALMVNQSKGGDIFSASSSGTTKFTISNAGNVQINSADPLFTFNETDNVPWQWKVSGDQWIVQRDSADKLVITSTSLIFKQDYLQNNASSLVRIGATAASSELRLMAGGTNDYLTIQSDGDVGIGTTTPSTKLTLYGTNADFLLKSAGADIGDIIFQESDGNQKARIWTATPAGVSGELLHLSTGDNSADITIDSTGAVGIGTSTTNGMTLEVLSTTGGQGIRAHNSSALGTGSGGALWAGTSNTPSAADQRTGGIFFSGSNSSSYAAGAAVTGWSGSAWSTSNIESYLRFETTPNAGTSRSERMRITSAGRVGIGTTTPSVNLHVNGYTSYSVTGPFSGAGANAAWATGFGTQNINTSILASNALVANGVYSASDQRLKENVNLINPEMVDAFLQNITPVAFNWKENSNFDTGFIAQDLIREGFGYLVKATPNSNIAQTVDEDGFISAEGFQYNVEYQSIIPILTYALQQQRTTLSSHSAKLENLSLNTDGDLLVQKTVDNEYGVEKTNGDVITQIATLAKLVAANIQAGAIITKELTTDSFTAFQGTIDNMLVKSGLVAANIETQMITPLADATDITIQIGKKDENTGETQTGKLSVQNANGNEVASIDTAGNATFSGTLYADDIKSKSLDEIKDILTKVETDQALLAQAADWDINTATGSANLSATNLVTTDLLTTNLYVTGQAAMNSLSLSQALSIGTDLVFQSTIDNQNSIINSIDTLTSPLRIQSLAMAPVEIMAGLIKIDTAGNMIISGNLAVGGRVESSGLTLKDKDLGGQSSQATDSARLLTLQNASGASVATIDASGSALFKDLTTQGLTIAGAVDATNSAVVDGVITTNATAGSGVIPSGTSEIIIKNTSVTDYTLVYVTPTSSTDNYVLYVKSKSPGEFVVGFTNPLNIDVNFNWWIVRVSQ